MNEQIVDILYISDNLVIARLSRTIWSMFSLFLIFCCYFTRRKACEISRFTRRKACEISRQNMGNLENIGHIVLRTVQ